MGYSPWCCKESDTTEQLTLSASLFIKYIHASLMAQRLKCLPAMRKTWVRSLGREDPLEEGMATHSGNLAWKIPMDKGEWRVTAHGVTKSWTRLND